MTDSQTATESTPTYAPGTPMWIDLTTPDLQGSVRFYSDLFSWQAEDMGEQMGHYTMFRQDGKTVAAATPPMGPPQPTATWSTYISVTNVEETARKATEAGGQVLVPPMQVSEEGSMAFFIDPTGAAFGVWQPNRMRGAELVNKPNSLSWNELQTRDMGAAKSFYTSVFPWTAKSNPMQDGEYIEWQVDGKSIGGGMAMVAQIPAQVPPHWLVYFAVANTDTTVKRAQELGATVRAPAMDIPQGRMAVLTDPHGASFAVIQLS